MDATIYFVIAIFIFLLIYSISGGNLRALRVNLETKEQIKGLLDKSKTGITLITKSKIGAAWLLILFMLLVGMPWFLADLLGRFTIFLLLVFLGIAMYLLLPSDSDRSELLRRWTKNAVMIVFCVSVIFYFLPNLLTDYYSEKPDWVDGVKDWKTDWSENFQVWASTISTPSEPEILRKDHIKAKPGEWSNFAVAPTGARWMIFYCEDLSQGGDIEVQNRAGDSVIVKQEEVDYFNLAPLVANGSRELQFKSLEDHEVPLVIEWLNGRPTNIEATNPKGDSP